MNTKESVTDLRKRFGWSQTKLDNRLNQDYGFNVTKHDISLLENGYATPKYKRLEIDAIKIFAKEQLEIDNAKEVLNV